MVNNLVSIVAYVTPEEKKSIERLAGGTVSNYVRGKLGLTPLRRGRGKTKQDDKGDRTRATSVKRSEQDDESLITDPEFFGA